ncbi:unnamed protein product [Effrenium voratum]|nr:unnamed protein product [Effrenium voratum]
MRAFCALSAAWAAPVPLRDVGAFVDPVFVPDFFFDLVDGAEVLRALLEAPEVGGQGYTASVLDEMVPKPPRMAPTLLWQTGLWKALSYRPVSQVIVDVGAHEWSRFLPELRTDESAWLVLVEPGRKAFLELFRRLKVDYADVLDRVVAIPAALSGEEGFTWGFSTLHTNDFLGGECNSLLPPDTRNWDHPCTEKGAEVIVPVMSLELLLHGVLLGRSHAGEDMVTELREVLEQGPPIHLKLDAQGSDVQILSALASSKAPLAHVLLDRLEKVQLEVSEDPIYEGQPLRHEVFARMFDMGFQVDWQKEEVHDGGVHRLWCGCRMVLDYPRTEDCFFQRSSSWAHGRVLDLVLRRPVEILRLNEGSELSISTQYSHYMWAHVEDCNRDEQMVRLRDETGTGLACLYGIAGWPLRHAILAVIELWDLIWFAVRGESAETKVAQYVRVFNSIWVLLSGGSWEHLHDAGAAHLVFMVLVEATCLAFPMHCGGREPAGSQTLCATLGACFEVFRSKAETLETVVENPADFVGLFRAAQRLTALRCFPDTWRLELDRSRSPHFPTTVSVGGGFNVTVLDVDSAECLLEISLVAWSPDAEGMLAFHRYVWEKTDRVKDLDSADFRVPSEGKLWDFDCLFIFGAGETRRSRGDVFSHSMLSEVPGTKDPPMLFVRCEAPSGDLEAPQAVRLVSALSRREMPKLELEVPLRRDRRPQVMTALCTQQVWDFEGLEKRAPHHAELWFRYFSELGVDEIYLYDLDGSFRDVGFVTKELQGAGRLVYEGSISRIPPLGDLYALAGYKTSTAHLAQTLVQQHCWQRARQNAQWVISVSHGWDMFLFSPVMASLDDLLQPQDDDDRKADRPGPAANVFLRFPFHVDPAVRPEELLSTEEHIVIANPRLVEMAVLGDVVKRQEAPLQSNLLRTRGAEFAGAMMTEREGQTA